MDTTESVRMFKSDILERFSHVHPYTPFILYIPVVLCSLFISIYYLHLETIGLIIHFIAGMIFWTLSEYVLHRFLFHIPQTNRVFKAIYFYSHGMHHEIPTDATRLVMPPGASIPLAIIFFLLFKLAMPVYYLPFFAGFVTFYMIYDFMHFATHFIRFKNRWYKNVRKHHMIHHYRDPTKNYGISNYFWDRVFFTTFVSAGPKEDQEVDDDSGLKPL